ncbi:MAG: hypothetical protein ACI8RD_014518 [Bacillariaceae sp.]|jgi:hypothetical protein
MFFSTMIRRQQQKLVVGSSPTTTRTKMTTFHRIPSLSSLTNNNNNNNKLVEIMERPAARRYHNHISSSTNNMTNIHRSSIRSMNTQTALFSTHHNMKNNQGDNNNNNNSNSNDEDDSVKVEGEDYYTDDEEEEHGHHHDDDDDDDHHHHEQYRTPNPGLSSIISQGSKVLESSADDIQQKTRRDSLLQPHKKPSFRNPDGVADIDPRQLAEGQRILDVALDCIDHLAIQYEERGGDNSDNGLMLFGEPIMLLECEVNRNIKQAKIFYTLPYEILLDKRINQKLYEEITFKVQKQLILNGGTKLLTKLVHSKLSYYYPPRIKLYPATDNMVQKAIKEFMM